MGHPIDALEALATVVADAQEQLREKAINTLVEEIQSSYPNIRAVVLDTQEDCFYVYSLLSAAREPRVAVTDQVDDGDMDMFNQIAEYIPFEPCSYMEIEIGER